MRHLLALSLLLVSFFFGCNQETDITSPAISSSEQQEINWITLPSPVGLSVNTLSFTVSELIDGSSGGELELEVEYEGGPFGEVEIDAELVIRPNSFTGTEEITMTITLEEGTVKFGPSMTFEKDLYFTLKYEGIDPTGVDPNTVKFCYIAADGSLVETENNGITVNSNEGTIKVKHALISHFSRYGFVN